MLSFIFLVVGVLAQQTFAEEPEAIVGGQFVLPGEFPYQASIRFNDSHICGGSIIGPTKILTVGHCVHGIAYPYTDLKVMTGSIDIFTGQLHEVKNIRMHPEFFKRAGGSDNDVAVVTLSEPIQYDKFQGPIALTKTKPVNGQQCTQAGWGKTGKNGEYPLILQKISQVVISLKKCQQRYPNVRMTKGNMCAYNSYGIGACWADSGNPLASNGKQIGIVSSVITPCARGIPDVFIDVYHYRNFILSS